MDVPQVIGVVLTKKVTCSMQRIKFADEVSGEPEPLGFCGKLWFEHGTHREGVI